MSRCVSNGSLHSYENSPIRKTSVLHSRQASGIGGDSGTGSYSNLFTRSLMPLSVFATHQQNYMFSESHMLHFNQPSHHRPPPPPRSLSDNTRSSEKDKHLHQTNNNIRTHRTKLTQQPPLLLSATSNHLYQSTVSSSNIQQQLERIYKFEKAASCSGSIGIPSTTTTNAHPLRVTQPPPPPPPQPPLHHSDEAAHRIGSSSSSSYRNDRFQSEYRLSTIEQSQQELKSQSESMLFKNETNLIHLENEVLDLHRFFAGLKDDYDKQLLEKDSLISSLRAEVNRHKEDIFLRGCYDSHVSILDLPSNTQQPRKLAFEDDNEETSTENHATSTNQKQLRALIGDEEFHNLQAVSTAFEGLMNDNEGIRDLRFQYQQTLDGFIRQLQRLKKENLELSTQLTSLKEKCRDLQESNERIAADFSRQMRSLADLRQRCEAAITQRDSFSLLLLKYETNEISTIKQLQGKYQAKEAALRQCREEVDALNEQINQFLEIVGAFDEQNETSKELNLSLNQLRTVTVRVHDYIQQLIPTITDTLLYHNTEQLLQSILSEVDATDITLPFAALQHDLAKQLRTPVNTHFYADSSDNYLHHSSNEAAGRNSFQLKHRRQSHQLQSNSSINQPCEPAITISSNVPATTSGTVNGASFHHHHHTKNRSAEQLLYFCPPPPSSSVGSFCEFENDEVDVNRNFLNPNSFQSKSYPRQHQQQPLTSPYSVGGMLSSETTLRHQINTTASASTCSSKDHLNLLDQINSLQRQVEESRFSSEQLLNERMRDFQQMKESQQRMEVMKTKLESKINELKSKERSFLSMIRSLVSGQSEDTQPAAPAATPTFSLPASSEDIDFFQLRRAIVYSIVQSQESSTSVTLAESMKEMQISMEEVKQLLQLSIDKPLQNQYDAKVQHDSAHSQVFDIVSPVRKNTRLLAMVSNSTRINHLNSTAPTSCKNNNNFSHSTQLQQSNIDQYSFQADQVPPFNEEEHQNISNTLKESVRHLTALLERSLSVIISLSEGQLQADNGFLSELQEETINFQVSSRLKQGTGMIDGITTCESNQEKNEFKKGINELQDRIKFLEDDRIIKENLKVILAEQLATAQEDLRKADQKFIELQQKLLEETRATPERVREEVEKYVKSSEKEDTAQKLVVEYHSLLTVMKQEISQLKCAGVFKDKESEGSGDGGSLITIFCLLRDVHRQAVASKEQKIIEVETVLKSSEKVKKEEINLLKVQIEKVEREKRELTTCVETITAIVSDKNQESDMKSTSSSKCNQCNLVEETARFLKLQTVDGELNVLSIAKELRIKQLEQQLFTVSQQEAIAEGLNSSQKGINRCSEVLLRVEAKLEKSEIEDERFTEEFTKIVKEAQENNELSFLKAFKDEAAKTNSCQVIKDIAVVIREIKVSFEALKGQLSDGRNDFKAVENQLSDFIKMYEQLVQQPNSKRTKEKYEEEIVLQQKVKELLEELNETRDQLNIRKEKEKLLIAEIEDKEKVIALMKVEYKEQCSVAEELLVPLKNKIDEKQEDLEKEMAKFAITCKINTEENNNLLTKLDLAENTVDSLKKDIQTITFKHEQAEAAAKILVKEAELLMEVTYAKEMSAKNTEIAELKRQFEDSLATNTSERESDDNRLFQDLQSARKDLASKEAVIVASEKAFEESQKIIIQLQTEITDLSLSVSDLRDTLKLSDSRHIDLLQQISFLTAQLSELDARAATAIRVLAEQKKLDFDQSVHMFKLVKKLGINLMEQLFHYITKYQEIFLSNTTAKYAKKFNQSISNFQEIANSFQNKGSSISLEFSQVIESYKQKNLHLLIEKNSFQPYIQDLSDSINSHYKDAIKKLNSYYDNQQLFLPSKLF